ncbi:MAG: hypothetical protein DI626_01075 [Micavibrio aeruginosavorus]|uniref:Lipoprotein n=1 Tax=Micavibrio aeruginosavorus TaxID=349221 RepID=A0A2W5A2D9_9BACT|nr:MAG: hypothetical protein DI626_01075 [Micavibrio aeruginosavorus]
MRSFVLITLSSLCLAACAHEAENTGAENSSVITLPAATYAMSVPEASAPSDSVITSGRISRYQRQMIVPGGPDGEMSPCAKNFDGVMDHLELLMDKQIRKNNEIAALQAAHPRYDF